MEISKINQIPTLSLEFPLCDARQCITSIFNHQPRRCRRAHSKIN